MDLSTILLWFGILACVYMACNIGANDVANAMGTSVGAKSLTFRQAVWDLCFFRNVHKLRPGHVLTLKSGEISTRLAMSPSSTSAVFA